MLTKAQAWFAGLKSSATSRTTDSSQVAINWEQATALNGCIIAPFVDTSNPFAGSQTYGYRFLVVGSAADSSYTGRVVELLVAGQPAAPEQAARMAVAGTKPLLNGQAPSLVEGLTGSLLVYSIDYQ
ncbi:MAG: hypothetical protein ACRYFX_12075 [Janthinobacterium lividum]